MKLISIITERLIVVKSNIIFVFFCRCPKKCFNHFSEVDQISIFNVMYQMGNKDQQDLHLQRMIDVIDVDKHRPRKQNAVLKDRTFKYHVLLHDTKFEVCREAFFSLYSVSDKRIRRIRQLLLQGKFPYDKRGKSLSGNTIIGDELVKIHEHIVSFPTKESHYASKVIKYLPSELTVVKMYNLYKEKYPFTTIKYHFYNKYFKENFSLTFGRPQVDTCSFCEEKKARLNSKTLNQTAKKWIEAELCIHMRRSKKFYTSLKNSEELSKNSNDMLGLVFDFMQNVDLPKIPVQDIFYYRQLTVNTFCVYNMKTGRAQFYLYHEGVAKKGPNEVASFLIDYIKDYVPQSVQELHIFSDNCPGQNKNHTLARVLLALTDSGRFKKIKQFFPLRGHSYLPCDRKFSVIKRPIRKCERIYTPYELCSLICGASNVQNTVKMVETSDIIDYKNWWSAFYKKNVHAIETTGSDYKNRQQFNISQFHYFEYCQDKKGTIKVSHWINGLHSYNFLLLKNMELIDLPQIPAYTSGTVPIKQTKIEDLKKILQYVPDEFNEFYREIINWQNTNTDGVNRDNH